MQSLLSVLFPLCMIYKYVMLYFTLIYFVNFVTVRSGSCTRANNLSCVLHRAAVENEIGHRLGLYQASPSLLGKKDGQKTARNKGVKDSEGEGITGWV